MTKGRLQRALDAGRQLDQRTGAYLVGELFWVVGPFIALAWVVLGSLSLASSVRHGTGSDVAVASFVLVFGLLIVLAGGHRYLARRRTRRNAEGSMEAPWAGVRDRGD
jgi:hypothetical protein